MEPCLWVIIHHRDGSFWASYDVTEKITHNREFYAAILVLICTHVDSDSIPLLPPPHITLEILP